MSNAALKQEDIRTEAKSLVVEQGLSYQKAADKLGLSKGYVYKLVNDGEETPVRSLTLQETVVNEHEERVNELETENERLRSMLKNEMATRAQLERSVKEMADALETFTEQKREYIERLNALETVETQRMNAIRQAEQLQEELNSLKAPGAVIMRFLHSDALVNVLLLIVSCALAVGITSQIFIHAGVNEIASYIIALGVDVAAFIFLSRGVHWGGGVFAALAAVQVIIVTGSKKIDEVGNVIENSGWIPIEWQVIIKSIALGFMVGGMLFGFGWLILKGKKETSA